MRRSTEFSKTKTAGGVLEILGDALSAKLKIGQIGELRRGFREFLSKNG
jgi:hypothetical protein